MVRLIVEQGGTHRAFKLGDGVLAVGSGEGQGLRLEVPGIAEHQLDLVVAGGSVRLRPVPGARPIRRAGAAVEGERELSWNDPVELGDGGSVRLWVDEGTGPVQPPARRQPGVQVPSEGDREALRQQAIARARGGARGAARRRHRPTKPAMPGWAIGLLVLTAAGAVFGVVRFGLRASTVAGETEITARLAAANERLGLSDWEGAQRRLDMITDDLELTPAQAEELARLRKELAAALAQSDLDMEMRKGTNYLEVYLRRYEANHLQGRPLPAQVRLFMKRIKEFRRRWPEHPEMDWVRRQESRFEGICDLSVPPTYEEAEWEISREVLTAPRNYRAALGLIEDLEVRAATDESIAAHADELAALRQRLETERLEYAADRLQQAKYEYERRKNPNKAVWWLLHSVIWLGDPALEEEAAKILVQFPDLDQHLRGYADVHPEKYELVLRNELVKRYAREHGLPIPGG